jgi:glycosyltransferase involved in cell wall biosynthesis
MDDNPRPQTRGCPPSVPPRTLSVVIPVYFNAESLPILFAELKEVEQKLRARGVGLELIFVNDGSGDNSLEELLKIKRERGATKIVSLARNFGSFAAVKVGFGFVTGDAFMLLTADLQDPPEQALAMADKWLEGQKFVVSVRASREDPATSRFFSWMYYRVVKWMVARDYPEGGYDLMLMDKVMLPYMTGAARNTNSLMYAHWLGFKPAILSYHRRARRHGRSRHTFLRKLKILTDTVCGFSAVPLRIMSLFGVIVALASFVYGIVIAFNALFGTVAVRGFASLAVLISFFSGLILIMLGTIGEYLWRVLDTVNNKPEAVIDETFL